MRPKSQQAIKDLRSLMRHTTRAVFVFSLAVLQLTRNSKGLRENQLEALFTTSSSFNIARKQATNSSIRVNQNPPRLVKINKTIAQQLRHPDKI